VTTRGIGRLRRAARRLRSRVGRRALILLYHRIAEVSPDPWRLSVTPGHFAEHLEVLGRHARPLRLGQLVESLRAGKCPRRGAVVTFDDGYADNLHNGQALLARFGIPATVFLVSSGIGAGREFWWDELERLLLQPGTLPETFRLTVNGQAYGWDLGEAAYYGADACLRDRLWEAWGEELPTPRHLLYRSLYELLHPLPEGDRQKALDQLVAWAGSGPAARATHRSLSLDETRALVEGELVEAGCHTMTHAVLSALPVAAQRDEIRTSKARLEAILGRPVASFAYPYGRRCDYTPETVALVREAGFSSACSNFAGVVARDTDRLQLPRMKVRDWDGETFSRHLAAWFDR
jgi:peptidoglycan/xylan/chitin deacetylase (PgdA/CDA1 family)